MITYFCYLFPVFWSFLLQSLYWTSILLHDFGRCPWFEPQKFILGWEENSSLKSFENGIQIVFGLSLNLLGSNELLGGKQGSLGKNNQIFHWIFLMCQSNCYFNYGFINKIHQNDACIRNIKIIHFSDEWNTLCMKVTKISRTYEY